MNVTVIYGTDNGATKTVASRIAEKLGGKALNVRSAQTTSFESCDLLVLGSPTCGNGTLQSDWEDKLETLKKADLTGKKVALFGTGDQISYPDTYLDAMGMLYDAVVEKGATVIGFTDTAGYDYSNSLAERDGKFVGLALDEDGQPDETEGRIATWTHQLM